MVQEAARLVQSVPGMTREQLLQSVVSAWSVMNRTREGQSPDSSDIGFYRSPLQQRPRKMPQELWRKPEPSRADHRYA